MLNSKQRLGYDRIITTVGVGGYYSLDGKAGQGKTFLVNAVCNRIRGEGRIACITGSTALSVTLYERDALLIPCSAFLSSNPPPNWRPRYQPLSGRAELLRQAALIV